jgi:hypothetical protein
MLVVGVILMVRDEFRDGDTGIYNHSTLVRSGKARFQLRKPRPVRNNARRYFWRQFSLA